MRQLVEYSGFCFLDKDKRGDFKTCEDVYYIGAMGHPGGGRNDIPNRLKRQFYTINLTPPSINSINDIYGQMLAGRFPARQTETDLKLVVNALTKATIKLWTFMQNKMLPTPAKRVAASRAVPSTRVHLTMPWVVSVPILGPFGPRPPRWRRRGHMRVHASRESCDASMASP